MKKAFSKKYVILTIAVVMLVVTFGISYSFFSYIKEGTTESTVKLGGITFKYTENGDSGNGINITDSFPIGDEEGKKLSGAGNVFEFKVESNLSRSDLEYEITVEATKESELPLDAIKFYLVELDGENEKEIESTLNSDGTVKTLADFSDTNIVEQTGKNVYQETILKNTKGYVKKFRVRMWISEDIDWADDNYANKSGQLRVNVYANSDRTTASTDTTTPDDVRIERVTANNKYLFTKVDSEVYQYELTVPNEVSVLDINVIPTNMSAVSSVTNMDNLEELGLNVGENYFRAVVTSSNGKKKKEYILKVVREKSNNTGLNKLEVEDYSLVPSYSDGNDEYTVTVPYDKTSIIVSAEKKEQIQEVTGLGTYNLTVGANDISVKVTAEDGTVRVIRINVIRSKSTDASIKNVKVEGYSLTYVEGNIYSVTIPNEVNSVEIKNVSETGAIVDNIGIKSGLKVGNNDYEVTVTSQDGSNVIKYIIRVIRLADSDNTLKSLSLSSCTLSPVFESSTISYTCTVENSVTSTMVTAEATSSVATVSGTGSQVLTVGENKIDVVVTSESGSVKTYTVTVTRKANSDATLKSLTVSSGTLSPTFASGTTSYTVTVPYSVDNITITGEVNTSTSNVVGLGSKNLIVGENSFDIVVTAEDKTQKTYTITVTRNKDTTDTLKSLSLSSCTLSPTFASGTTSYTCTVENSVTSTTVTAEATSSVATVSGTGSKSLSVGNNTVSVVVTSQSGSIKTYTVTVTRKANSDATLKSLTVSSGTLSPAFSSGTTGYTLTVPYGVDTINITGEANVNTSSVTGLGNKSLKVGENSFDIVVTAEDKTQKTYTITITRQADTTNTLKSLSLSSCTLSPTFASGTTSYTCTVENSVTSTTVTATATSSVATVSGTGSKSLSVGSNTISVIVTSQSGSVKTYTVTVTRKANSDATLKSLTVSSGTLSPAFNKDVLIYTLEVPYSVDNITITGEVNVNTSNVEGLGSKVLKVGENSFDIVVTAEDKTTKTYNITVTRKEDSDTSLKSIGVKGYDIVKVDNNNYTLTVENNVTSVEIVAEALSSVASVSGTGVKSLKVGKNKFGVIVTAQNGDISTYNVIITRKASSDATLKNLTVSSGTLSPTFASGTTSYTLTVPYSVTSLTVTPTVNNSEAKTSVTGNTSLTVGSNTVSIVVTAGDGTMKTYTITVTRSKDTTNTLKSLSLSSCTLSPTFASGTTSYTCTVENSVTSTTVTATATSSVATVSGTGSKSLSVGSNTVSVVVTSQSGAKKAYTVTVTRKASSDATLKGLTVSNGTLSPTFASGTTSYTLTVPYSVTSLTVTPTVNNSEAKTSVTGNTSLTVGSNTVSIVVTAGDGTKKTYTITVTRSKDTTNTLKSLSLSSCTLSPTFASGTTSYTCTVENSVISTTVTAAATSSVATVSGTGSKSLSVGSNTVSVVVTSQSGSIKTYTVTVTRKASSDATLKGLTVSNGTLSPTFASGTTSYTLTVPYSVTSLTVTPTVNNSEAKTSVTGNTSLKVGSNTVSIVVTAGDGTKKTYAITVTRSKDTTNTLKSLSLSSCTLSPTFASGTTSYTCTVENSVTSTTVTATATSSVATVSGTGSKSLSVGSNTVSVVVTSQSGAKKTYTVTVTRKASSDATLKGLIVSSGTLSPTFASGTTSYTLTVPYSVTSLTVTPTVNNSEAKTSVTGNTSLTVGSNTVSIVVTAGNGTKKTYTITVTRSKDTTNTLKSLAVSGYSLTPTFASGTTEYTLTLEASSITVTAAATSSVATVSGTGSKSLNWGTNTISVIVTSQSGSIKTYKITVDNQRPTAPVLQGGSDSWVSVAPTISIKTAGGAISGVKNYEYYKSTSNTAPTDTTTATGTTTGNLTVSDEGTSYVWYRTVSNNGFKSSWTSGPQVIKLDTTTPSIILNPNLPSSVTKGDSYAIIKSYSTSTISGGTKGCSSNIDGQLDDNYTSSLKTVGTHIITCTVATNAGKKATATVTIKITYTAYTATNLIKNGSFENGLNDWNLITSDNSTIKVNTTKYYGNYSANIDIITNSGMSLIDSNEFNTPLNHLYYFSLYSYINRINIGYVILGEIYNSDKTSFNIEGVAIEQIVNNGWTKYSKVTKHISNDNKSIFRIGIYPNDSLSVDGNAYFDGVLGIDLTATFGSGNEPDKDWCDKHINYFDGTTTIYK